VTNQLADRVTLAYNLVVPAELRRAWTGGGDRAFNKITGIVDVSWDVVHPPRPNVSTRWTRRPTQATSATNALGSHET
jgi:hypothetical protein